MKNLIILSVFALVLIGCTKLTESNIVGKWNVVELNVDGDNMVIAEDMAMEFQSDGTLLLHGDGQVDTGTYTLTESDQTITVDVDGEVTIITVSEKKGKKMTLNYQVDGASFIIKLKKE